MSTRTERATLPTYPDLAGKTVTGGIGAATCRLLADCGAKIAVNGRDEAKIDAVVGDPIAGQVIGVSDDVTRYMDTVPSIAHHSRRQNSRYCAELPNRNQRR